MPSLPTTFEWLTEFLPSLLAATACGLLLGYERERRGRPIGLKTCTLVCVGATTYMASGHLILQAMPGSADPTRMASQIVTGIGFLGAGAILRGPEGISGLTSAATIWFLGAVGVLIGCRYRLAGVLLTLAVLAILLAARFIENLLFRRHEAMLETLERAAGVTFLAVALAGLAGSVPAAAQDIQYFVDTGPLRVRDQFLLNMGFLAFDPAPATVLGPGEWQVDAVLTATNTFAHSGAMEGFLEARKARSPLAMDELRSLYADGEGIFQLDAEVYRTAVAVRRGIGHRLQLEALIPILDFQGGFGDGIIEEFHDTFGFGQSGRLGVPRDGYLVYVRSREGELAAAHDPGAGLGDVVLGAKLDLKRRPRPLLLAVQGQVKLPTGDEDSLYSSGKADAGVQLLASRYFRRACVHASAGILYLGPWDALGTSGQFLPSAMLAYEHAFGGKVSGILQATVSQSPFDDLELEELSAVSYQMSAGLKVAVGERKMLFLALTENLVHLNNTADVGLHLGLSQTF